MAHTGGFSFSHIVAFKVDARAYALPLANVTRAVRMVAITPVPDAPGWLSGVINVAGQIIPVIDLRRRLGLTAKSPDLDDRLLIINVEGYLMAAIVDEVTRVIEVAPEALSSPGHYLSDSQPVAAALRYGDDLLMILDAAKLAPRGT